MQMPSALSMLITYQLLIAISISIQVIFCFHKAKAYWVMVSSMFDDGRHNIAGLSYVDFWIENKDGIEIVFQEAGQLLAAVIIESPPPAINSSESNTFS